MNKPRRAGVLLTALILCASSAGVALADYLEVLRKASVREEPDVRSKRIVKVPKGAFLPLLDWRRTNDYFRVALPPGDEEGWIHYSVVRKKDGDPPESFKLELPKKEAESEGRQLAWWARGDDAEEVAEAPPEPAVAPTAAPVPRVQREVEVRSSVEPLAVGNPAAFTERGGEGYAFVIDHRTGLLAWGQYELTRESAEGAQRLEERFFEGGARDAVPVLDSPGWNALAGAVKGWVAQRGALSVIVGPVFESEGGRVSYALSGRGHAIPTHLFKVLVFAPKSGEASALAFLFPNDAGASPLIDRATVSIDSIEASTGLDLLSALPEEVQARLESSRAKELW